ncbi:MAG: hypothetical protein IMF06_06685 [Proteobacteria bacterium]|nr:hypothetical protein [Pseudomonadota bacterium]
MSSFNSQYVKRALFTASLGIVFTGLSACGEPVEKMEPATVLETSTVAAQATVPEIISQAEAKYAEAAALSHAWTTTRTLIEQARAALEAGDAGKARALAEQALATAVASVEQAGVEAQAWQSRVPQ